MVVLSYSHLVESGHCPASPDRLRHSLPFPQPRHRVYLQHRATSEVRCLALFHLSSHPIWRRSRGVWLFEESIALLFRNHPRKSVRSAYDQAGCLPHYQIGDPQLQQCIRIGPLSGFTTALTHPSKKNSVLISCDHSSFLLKLRRNMTIDL